MNSKKITYSSLVAILSIVFMIAISIVVSKNKNLIENVKTPEIVIEEEGGIPCVSSFENLYSLLKINEVPINGDEINQEEENISIENTEEINTEEDEDIKEFETSDNNYDYYVMNNKIYISNNNKTLSKLDYSSTDKKSITINNIIIYNDKLVIIYTSNDLETEKNSTFTNIEIYNIKNKRKPKFSRELKIEGTYLKHEAIDNNIYVLTTKELNIKPFIGKEINDIDEDLFKPLYGDSNKGKQDCSIDFDNMYYFENSEYKNYLNILGFDLTDEIETYASSYIGTGDEIYVFDSGIYIVKTIYDYKDPAIYGYYNNLSINSYIYKLKYDNCKIEYSKIVSVAGDIFKEILETNGYLLAVTEDYTTWESDTKEKNIYLIDSELNIKSSKLKIAPTDELQNFYITENTIVLKISSEEEIKFTIDYLDNENPQIL